MRRTCAVVLRFPSRTRARWGCAFARHGHMLKHFLRREGSDCNSFHEPWLENCFITATKNSTGAPFREAPAPITNVLRDWSAGQRDKFHHAIAAAMQHLQLPPQ